MPDMQSRHCCLCVTGVLATFVGFMVFTAGVSFVINYRFNDLPLPPQWQTVTSKKNIGIVMICLGLAAFATGILVSLCFFTSISRVCLWRHLRSRKNRNRDSLANKPSLDPGAKGQDTDSISFYGSQKSLNTKSESLEKVTPPVTTTKPLVTRLKIPPRSTTRSSPSTVIPTWSSNSTQYPLPTYSSSEPTLPTVQHEYTQSDPRRHNEKHTRKSGRKMAKHAKRLEPHVEEGEIYGATENTDRQWVPSMEGQRHQRLDRQTELMHRRNRELMEKRSHRNPLREVTVDYTVSEETATDSRLNTASVPPPHERLSEGLFIPNIGEKSLDTSCIQSDIHTLCKPTLKYQNYDGLKSQSYTCGIDDPTPIDMLNNSYIMINDDCLDNPSSNTPSQTIVVSEAGEMIRSESAMQDLNDGISKLINMDPNCTSSDNTSYS